MVTRGFSWTLFGHIASSEERSLSKSYAPTKAIKISNRWSLCVSRSYAYIFPGNITPYSCINQTFGVKCWDLTPISTIYVDVTVLLRLWGDRGGWGYPCCKPLPQ